MWLDNLNIMIIDIYTINIMFRLDKWKEVLWIWVATCDSVVSDMWVQQRLKSPCVSRSFIRVIVVHIKNFSIHGYSKQSKWRFLLDCENVQADLNIRWLHVSESTFSEGVAYSMLLFLQKFSVPWLSMLKAPCLWACLTAHVCNNWTNYTLLTNIPTFMKEVLKFDIKAVRFSFFTNV